MAPKNVRRSVVKAPAECPQPARDEAPIQLLRALNTRLLKEIKQLRSDLAASVTELRRANDELEAERALASEATEKLIKKVEEKNLKTAEAAGLKLQLEESIKGNDDTVLNCSYLQLKLNDLAAKNEHLEYALETREATIKDLSRDLELVQSRENKRDARIWLFPLAAVAIAAGAMAFAARAH